ncbi:sulfite exporter TauE/SafE family protein [Rhodocytophaga rosea]|uniref:Probable membrane transporter protein n=1 Tax=Rhodocytophaga rosea TaxID=2704465 RepID=A0A6C0GFA3_9BACT|nr:sulfite exporter TauE/SafE family protein [Rhodocytophaga rosea]QHT66709.1 sulfite exporter TauE/SafE family protein [Rhodocytophaga rosea]
MPDIYWIAASFFIIALVYASVGFGGGSSYLAIMALFDVQYLLMRSTSLLCNILVVAGGTYIFYKRKHLSFKRVLPFALASIPMSFLGGLWPLKQEVFTILLGLTLLATACVMWFFNAGRYTSSSQTQHRFEKGVAFQLLTGGSIGLLSGLVGIGGGIFLSPVLFFTRWGTAQEIAAASSVFILINSISGLSGQLLQGNLILDFNFVAPLLLAVSIGGQIGSRMGATIFNQLTIKRLTAILILIVSLNILKNYLGA